MNWQAIITSVVIVALCVFALAAVLNGEDIAFGVAMTAAGVWRLVYLKETA